MKFQLLNKLKKSSRFNIISDSFYSHLLEKYKLSYKNEDLEYFYDILNADFLQNKWVIPQNIDEDKVLLSILNNDYTYLDFATYIEDNQRSYQNLPFKNIITDIYKKFMNIKLLNVYKSNLERENPDYRFVIKEYREGLLLFNLMQDKIWTFRDSDSLNLKKFFDENKSDYNSFEDDKGKIIGDFQDFQEAKWIVKLKSKHKITFNNKAIRKLKKRYN